jgi:hypothetical protein
MGQSAVVPPSQEQTKLDLQNQDKQRAAELREEQAAVRARTRDENKFLALHGAIRCAPCYFAGRTCQAKPSKDCADRNKLLKTKPIRNSIMMRTLIHDKETMKAFGGCYTCYLPQTSCNNFYECNGKMKPRTPRVHCHYRNVMLDAIYIAISKNKACEKVYQRLLQDAEIPDMSIKLAEWFGQRIDWPNLEANNVCKVFLAVMTTYLESKM